MRAFIAVGLPSEIKDALYSIQKKIGSKYAKVKWVAKKNLHLTIKFFSITSPSKLEQIKEKLSNLKFKPFKVKLDDMGFFPSKDNIRVIWVGLQNFEKLMDIQGEIELKLGKLYPKDERFAVHLTLGRVKIVKDKEKFLKLLKEVEVPNIEFEIKELILMKSILTKDGPKYSVIKRF